MGPMVSKSKPASQHSTEPDSTNSVSGWTRTLNSEKPTLPPLLVIPSVIHSRIPPVQLSTFLSNFPLLLPSFSETTSLTTTSSETPPHQSIKVMLFSLDATPLVTTQTPLSTPESCEDWLGKEYFGYN